MQQRPDERIIRREEIVADHGVPRLRVTTSHTQVASDPNGLRHEYDVWVATEAYKLLSKAYTGYSWSVEADSFQGIVKISIPVLLGPCWCFLIKWGDLTPAQVLEGGGQLLEMFKLPRSMIDLAAFVTARNNAPNFNARTRPGG